MTDWAFEVRVGSAGRLSTSKSLHDDRTQAAAQDEPGRAR
jgi:hypothetical protein